MQTKRWVYSVLRILALSLIVCSSPLQADLITLDATDSGFYFETGEHQSGNTNYLARTNFSSSNTHNFFTFDLSTVSGTITAATLSLGHPETYSYSHSSTYTVFDVLTPTATLTSSQSPGAVGQAIYLDLGSGVTYGSFAFDPNFQDAITEIPLTNAALVALNAAVGGTFALGGSLSTSSSDITEVYTNTSAANVRRLELTTVAAAAVPEPSSLALLGVAGTATLIAMRRRAKNAIRSMTLKESDER